MNAAQMSAVTAEQLAQSLANAWQKLQTHEAAQFQVLESLLIREDLPPVVKKLLDALDRASMQTIEASGVFAECAQTLVNHFVSKTGAHHGNAGH